MPTAAEQLRQVLADFEKTSESTGLELRLSFSELVLDRLREKGWTQKKLAEKCGQKEAFISRVIHGDANCTFDTAGRILWALGVRPAVVERHDRKRLTLRRPRRLRRAQ